MELADKTGAKKYDDYVLKNMNFVFNEGTLKFAGVHVARVASVVFMK